MAPLDAIVIGTGPNGLAAAITIARTGRTVTVFESADTCGGGCRSAELTLPGFVHDLCSAVHPFAAASPFFRTLPLRQHGLEWLVPPAQIAHPFEDGRTAIVDVSVERTAEGLGHDRAAYRELFQPLVDDWPQLERAVMGPLTLPRHPIALARFGRLALDSAAALAQSRFSGDLARGLMAGVAAHSMLPLERRPTAGVALTLTLLAHIVGWPIPRGGAQRISDALTSSLRALGGTIVTGTTVRALNELPPARAVLCDLSPKPLLRIAGSRFSDRYRRALERFRYGLGTYKVDWALDGPIPWKNPNCARAVTVHLGGTLDEIAAGERGAWDGRIAEWPFVLLAQPSVVDDSRAPQGRHVVWTYCHVPHGSPAEMVLRIERQIERFAPGFRDRVLARAIMRPADIEQRNANLVGGDIAGGVMDLRQLFTRPTWRTYSTPARGLYLCSSSTPPGVGVHGMCGYFAARRALREVFGVRTALS